LARHPIYGGGLTLFAGISLAVGLSGLAGTAVLAVLWWHKARLEDDCCPSATPATARTCCR